MWEFLDLERERDDSVCWPNNKIIDAAFCKLYSVDPRHHLYTFAKTVNTKSKSVVIRETMAGLDLSVLDSGSVTGSLHGWRKCRTKFGKDQKKKFDGMVIYFWWNIWKERNRGTFRQKSLQQCQVALLCSDDIQQYQLATRTTARGQER